VKNGEHCPNEDAHFNDGDVEEPELGRLAASGYRLEGLMRRLSFSSRDESCMMAGWRTAVLTVISF